MRKSLAMLFIIGSLVCLSQAPVASAELPELLVQHREAMGGDEIKSITSVQTRVHYSMMMIEGTLETLTVAPDKVWNKLDTAVFSFTEASDGNVKWKIDQNNQVTQNDDPHKLTAPNPVLPEYQYLFPNEEITVTDAGTEEIDGVEYRVLEIDAPGYKKTRRKFIDPKTLLCMREEFEESGIGITVVYSEFKEYGGYKMATKAVQSVAVPGMPETTMILEDVKMNAPVDMSLFAVPGSETRDYHFPENHQVTVPLVIKGEHLFIETEINGEGPYLFLLDSGAASTIIDAGFAKELNLDRTEGMHIIGVGGVEQSEKIDIKELAIGDFRIDELKLFSMDLSQIGEMLGFESSLNGIVGYDLFARAVVKLDYQNQQVTIIDPAHFNYEGPGKAVPGEIINNLINIEGTVDGDIVGKLRIDTGAGGGLHLHSGYLKEHGKMDRYQGDVEVELMGAGGSQTLHLVKVKSVKLGEFEVKEPLTTLMIANDGEQSIMGTLEAIGTVGNQVLGKFVIYFDYDNNQLILEPTSALTHKTPQNRAGMIVTDNEDGSLGVAHVLQGSPAAEAGFVVGDKILQMAGLKPGKGLTADTANRMLFSKAEITYRFKIEREGSAKTLKLKLADLAQ